MPDFTRTWRALRHCYPGTGGWQGPNRVSDDIQLVHQIWKPSVCLDVVLGESFQSAATGGASTTLTHPEPAAGHVHVPVVANVGYDGVANARVDVYLSTTASALDAWGRFVSGNRVLFTVRVVSGATILIPNFPYTRGSQLQIVIPNPAAGSTVNSLLLYLDMPAEFSDMETWKTAYGNFTNTFALP